MAAPGADGGSAGGRAMGRERMLGLRWLTSGHELVHQLQTIWIESAVFFVALGYPITASTGTQAPFR